jgi:hypothetical protein
MARTVLALREGMCGLVPEKLSRARKAARDFALGTAGQCGQLPKGRSPGAHRKAEWQVNGRCQLEEGSSRPASRGLCWSLRAGFGGLGG